VSLFEKCYKLLIRKYMGINKEVTSTKNKFLVVSLFTTCVLSITGIYTRYHSKCVISVGIKSHLSKELN